MKRLVLLFAILLAFGGAVSAIPNPAAVYCVEQGYQYEIRTRPGGGQYGVCIFPDGSECGEWDYYCGCEPNGIGCWAGDFNCDFPCEELACKETGEFVTISRCCEGLREIARKEAYTDECRLVGWIGWVYICSDCGNGICESWESICNCPEDCARVHNITQDRYYERIQDAIDDANDGDEIVVADGIYTGEGNRDIDFRGKAIMVRSENGPENCIIDCEGTSSDQHRGFRFHRGEDADSVLEGFTITNGYAPITAPHSVATGGAIDCINSSPTIRQCIIRSNLAGVGGGIYCGESESVISNCEISGNSARYGGGIRLHTCSAKISNCLITDNMTWERNGAGMIVSFSDANISNCTFSNNTAHMSGGAIYYDESMVMITNCILWENSPTEISEGPRVDGAVRYSDVQGSWPGQGNIDQDPCFAFNTDYHIMPDSPCIDAGTDANVYTDIEGNVRPFDFPGVDNNGELPEFDMGAYELVLVQAAMKFTPQTLNCNSKGKYIKAHLVLPEGFLPEDVDVNESAIAEPMGAESEYIKVLGAGTSPVKLEIYFDRETFCDLLTDDDSLEVTVIGSLTTSRYFYATDTIRIKPRH